MKNSIENMNKENKKNKWVGLTFVAREWRMPLMAERIENNLVFEKVDGTKIKIKYDAELIAALKAEDIAAFNKVKHLLCDTSGNRLCLSNLGKTPVFGGKGIGNANDNIEQYETIKLNDSIKKINKPINIKIGDKIYPDIIGAKQTHSKIKAKSDIELFTRDETTMWISHKAGTKPKHFQQWSGVSTLKEYDEVQQFAESVSMWMARNGTDLTKQMLMRQINSNDLKILAMYGHDYFSNCYGKNNVTAIMQGAISFIAHQDYYEIMGTAKTFINGEIPLDGYEPYFVARLDLTRNDMCIKNTRIMIFSKSGIRNNAISI